MRVFDTFTVSSSYTFNPLKISVGLRSGNARASVASFATAIREISNENHELFVELFHIETKNDWAHFIVTVRPTSGTWAAMSVSTVRGIQDRLLSRITSQWDSALCFVWPTGIRTPLSSQQLYEIDPNKIFIASIQSARSFLSTIKASYREFTSDFIEVQTAIESGKILHPSSAIKELYERILHLKREFDESEGHFTRLVELKNGIKITRSEVNSYVDESRRYTRELESYRASIREDFSHINQQFQVVIDSDAQINQLHDQLDVLVDTIQRDRDTLHRTIIDARSELVSIIHTYLSEDFTIANNARLSSQSVLHIIEQNKTKLRSLAAIFLEHNVVQNSALDISSFRDELIAITGQVDAMFDACLGARREIDAHWAKIQALRDDVGSDGVLPGDFLREWVTASLPAEPIRAPDEAESALASITQSALDRADAAHLEALAAQSRAATALDRLSEAVERLLPWIVQPREPIPPSVVERHTALLDDVRWFLNERGQGTWAQLSNIIELVLEGDEAPDLRANQVARRLRLLGYVESDFTRNRWSVAPTVATPLVARSSPELSIYALYGQVNLDLVDALKDHASISWAPHPECDGPSVVLVTCASIEDIAPIFHHYSVPIQDSARRIVDILPTVDVYTRSIIDVTDSLNLNLVQSAAHRSGRLWEPAALTSGRAGFWRLTFGNAYRSETVEAFRDPITNAWFQGEREVLQTRLGLHSAARQTSVQYTNCNDEGVPALRIRREWRWPDLYERALVLSSGYLPMVRQSLRGPVLEYRFVPPSIARDLSHKMLISNPIGFNDE